MITIVVPTWNRWYYTKRCLERLDETTDVDFQLIVVDNASLDETRDELQRVAMKSSFLRDYLYVLLDENIGGGRALNVGFDLAGGDPLVDVNNDILLPYGWASHLLKALSFLPDAVFGASPIDYVPGEKDSLCPRLQDACKRTVFEDVVFEEPSITNVGGWFTAMMKSTYRKVGKFEAPVTSLYGSEDLVFDRKARVLGVRIGYLNSLPIEFMNDVPDPSWYAEFKLQQRENWAKGRHGEWSS